MSWKETLSIMGKQTLAHMGVTPKAELDSACHRLSIAELRCIKLRQALLSVRNDTPHQNVKDMINEVLKNDREMVD